MHKLSTDFEIPNGFWTDKKNRHFNGGKLTEYYEMFNLDPGKYVFSFVVGFSKMILWITKNLSYLVKIGSTSKCDFEESVDKKGSDITEL